jgi:hypothetical protein
MRFCHPFTLTVNIRDGKKALVRRKCIGAKSRVQCDQPHFIVFSPRTIFLKWIARPTPFRENLTEFSFARNFSKPDLEVL